FLARHRSWRSLLSLQFGLRTSGASVSRPGFPHRTPLVDCTSWHVLQSHCLGFCRRTSNLLTVYTNLTPGLQAAKQPSCFFSPNCPGRTEPACATGTPTDNAGL